MLSSLDCSEPVTVITSSADETAALGRAAAALLRPGDVVVLDGALGTGKTTFVKGIVAGLGCGDVVWSPTFTIVRELRGMYPIRHIDLYRLETVGEVEDLGLDELLDGSAVLLVEWGGVVAGLFGDQLQVSIDYTSGDERAVTVRGCGESWVHRQADLARLVTGAVGPCSS
jgi:tRNA threonylcarbamoyladenosine biosynthesis protein TsaE